MTDTEILDALQNDYTMHRGTPRDLQFGKLIVTLGLKPGTLRELLIEAIQREDNAKIDAVTKALVGIESAPKVQRPYPTPQTQAEHKVNEAYARRPRP